MGEKSGTLYYSDGVPVGEFPAITLGSKEGKSEAMLMATAAFSGDIAVMKRSGVSCKSRKRFIKLLMTDGISRNDANKLAEITQNCGYSYQEQYYFLNPFKRFFKTRTVRGNAERQ